MREGAQALELKPHIEEKWQFPPTWQKLVVGHALLKDEDTLDNFREEGVDGVVSVLVVVSIDSVITALVDPRSQWMDLEKAVAAASQLGSRAIPVVCEQVHNEAWHTRRVAIKALEEIASPGDESVLDILQASTEDEDWGVRVAAMEALAKLLSSRSIGAGFSKVAARLQDQSWVVRCKALQHLPKFSTKGDAEAVQAVVACCGDRDSSVRRMSLSTLQELAERGDEKAIAATLSLLGDNHWSVRKAAAEALGHVADLGSAESVAALQHLLRAEEDEAVRSSARRAITALSLRG